MNKFKTGQLYRVNCPDSIEHGNIIRIENVPNSGTAVTYSTIKNKKPLGSITSVFSPDSIFANSLVRVAEKIVIYRKGNEVVAVNNLTGKEGVARCAPGDTFNFETGAKLAFGRLVGEDTATEPVKPEEPKFKVGEFVRVVDTKPGGVDKLHFFPIKQIVQIVEVHENSYVCNGVVKRRNEGYRVDTQIVYPEHIEKLEEA